MEDKFIQIFREFFNNPGLDLTRETTAANVKGWDSFAHISLVLTLEDAYNIKLSSKDLTGLKDVGQMYDKIIEKSQGV